MFIIDGYNLLWSIHKASEDGESFSDVDLCRTIGRYLELIGDKGQVVFDGTGPPDKSGFDNITGVEVAFSGRVVDCDTIIKHKITASTAPRRLTVVSSDRELRDAARARRATTVKSEVFWKDVLKQLSRGKERFTEPDGKRRGLNESETEQWLRFFGLEQ